MSEPTNDEWLLDDQDEELDTQEDSASITKIRQHFTIQIHKQVLCDELPERGQISVRRQRITYRIGSKIKTKDAPTGCMFICVRDGWAPLEHPGDYAIRRQTWEVFGKFIAAPEEWNK